MYKDSADVVTAIAPLNELVFTSESESHCLIVLERPAGYKSADILAVARKVRRNNNVEVHPKCPA